MLCMFFCVHACMYMLTYVYMAMCGHACCVGCKLSSYKNGLALLIMLLLEICKSSSHDMPYCSRVIMGFYFGFSVKTVKSSKWVGRKFVVYGHGNRHGAGVL